MNTALAALPADPAYDVVVIGAGAGGMAAALFAALRGLSVLLVERTEFVGGTTALSGGTTWVPNTRHAAGTGDTPAKAAHFLDSAVGNASPAAMRQAFLDHGPAAIAALEAATDVQFRPYALHPDYMQEMPDASLRGRALEPLPFDARALGGDFALLRPPIPEFTVLGGMMVDRNDVRHLLNMTRKPASFRHSLKLLARHFVDRLRFPRGTRLVMGNALAGRMLLSLARQKNAALVTRTEVTGFLPGPATPAGGVTLASGSETRRVTARCGIVLASGGFNLNPVLRRALLPELAQYCPGAPGHTGAAHEIALSAGAVYGPESRDNAFWAPVSVRRRADGSTAVFPHFVLDRSKPGTFCVNASGRRFVNESTSYHEFARAMFETNASVPSIPTFLICDAVALRKYGLGMVRPGGGRLDAFLADGYLIQAASIAELAGRIGVDAAALADTVRRMNDYARTGTDPDFGRGTTPYHRVNGDPEHPGPNPTLGPIVAPPFYAVKLVPGDIGAARGFAADTNARVLNANGQPIPGLYACGNDLQSIMGGTYPAPGITIGPAIAFAYIAANDLAERAA